MRLRTQTEDATTYRSLRRCGRLCEENKGKKATGPERFVRCSVEVEENCLVSSPA